MNPDEIDLEQLAQEDALFPWLATDEMADHPEQDDLNEHADEPDPESEEAYLDRLDSEGDNDF